MSLTIYTSPAYSTIYSENFETLNHRDVTTFTTTHNGLSATYEGGTVFTAGIGSLYHSGTKSWMVDPDGINGSTGIGTLTLSDAAKSLKLYFRDQNAMVASTLQVMNSDGGVIQEFTGTNSTWTEVKLSRNDGDTLIKTIKLVNNGSSGMTALDDISYSPDEDINATPGGGGNNGGGNNGGGNGGGNNGGGNNGGGNNGGGNSGGGNTSGDTDNNDSGGGSLGLWTVILLLCARKIVRNYSKASTANY